MEDTNPIELRVELFSDDGLSSDAIARVRELLTERWPVAWDFTQPPHPTLEHPLRWHAVVPLPEGSTPEGLHLELEAAVRSAALSPTLHLRTRWALPADPGHQEIYEAHWSSGRS